MESINNTPHAMGRVNSEQPAENAAQTVPQTTPTVEDIKGDFYPGGFTGERYRITCNHSFFSTLADPAENAELIKCVSAWFSAFAQEPDEYNGTLKAHIFHFGSLIDFLTDMIPAAGEVDLEQKLQREIRQGQRVKQLIAEEGKRVESAHAEDQQTIDTLREDLKIYRVISAEAAKQVEEKEALLRQYRDTFGDLATQKGGKEA